MRHHVQLTTSILILLAVAKAAEEPHPPTAVPPASQCTVSLMQTDLRLKTLKEEADKKAPAQHAQKGKMSSKFNGEVKGSSDSQHLTEIKASKEYVEKSRLQQGTSNDESKTIDITLNSELQTLSHTKAGNTASSAASSSMYQILAAGDLTMVQPDSLHKKRGSLATCLPLVIFLCMGWSLKFAMKDRFQTGGLLYICLVSASFCAASISMSTLNMACVSLTGAPSILTAIQMTFTVAATLALNWKEVVGADRKKLLWWCLVPVFYAGLLNSSLFSYKYISLSLMIVFRNLAPLVTMTVESFVMDVQDAPTVTPPVVLAILVMVIGALLFTVGESDASWIGLTVVLLNTFLAVVDRVIQRRLLVSECKGLPLSACMTLNNSLGMLPTLAMALAMHEVQTIPAHQAAWTDPATLLLIGLSCLMGMGIGYFGLMCQQAMTAASFQVLGNLSKVGLVFVGVWVFGDNMDSRTRQGGMLLSILGSVTYGLSRAWETAEKHAGSGERQALLGGKLAPVAAVQNVLEKIRPAAGNKKATDQAR